MKGESVLYNGRLVAKDGFRAFIYGFDNQKKLVNSWAEYQRHMDTKIWFATPEDVVSSVPEEKSESVPINVPKRTRKKGND